MISVLIPTRNRVDYIRQTIASVFAQTYRPLELIISDDSTDEATRDLMQNYSSTPEISIRYLRNTPPLGQAGNVNQLFHMATGERLILIHDDDMLLNEAIRILSDAYNTYPDTAAAYGMQRLCDDLGNDLGEQSAIDLNSRFHRTPECAGPQPCSVASALLRQFPNNGYLIDSSLARFVQYRNESEVGHACDADFGLRFAIAGKERKFVFVPAYTSINRQTKTSILRGKNSLVAASFWNVVKSLDIDHPLVKSAKEKALYDLAPDVARELADSGKRWNAIRIWLSRYYNIRRFSQRGIYCLITILIPGISRFRHALQSRS